MLIFFYTTVDGFTGRGLSATTRDLLGRGIVEESDCWTSMRKRGKSKPKREKEKED